MQLTEGFTLEEMTRTSTGLPNEPTEVEKSKLLYLATYLLEPIRKRWGRVKITSGYRSPGVNLKVGGASSSQHVKAEAADIVPLDADIDAVFAWIVKESGIKFGQAIRESKGGADWIHVSLPRLKGPNQQALTYDGKEYKTYGL